MKSHTKTCVVNHTTIPREWYVVDAGNAVLGRLASNVAGILMGKKKAVYAPHQDHGDHVIVINADKVQVTGNKAETKVYFRHSTQPGGHTSVPFKKQMAVDSTKVIRHAIHGMLPKTALGRAIMKKLHVYRGAEHLHAAQNPKVLAV
jgi:large subunit ribosomal protein L13